METFTAWYQAEYLDKPQYDETCANIEKTAAYKREMASLMSNRVIAGYYQQMLKYHAGKVLNRWLCDHADLKYSFNLRVHCAKPGWSVLYIGRTNIQEFDKYADLIVEFFKQLFDRPTEKLNNTDVILISNGILISIWSKRYPDQSKLDWKIDLGAFKC